MKLYLSPLDETQVIEVEYFEIEVDGRRFRLSQKRNQPGTFEINYGGRSDARGHPGEMAILPQAGNEVSVRGG